MADQQQYYSHYTAIILLSICHNSPISWIDFMAVRKPQDVLRINVSQTDLQQSQLVKYLRDSGQITSRSMAAIEAYWYSYALAADRDIPDATVELAVSESVLALSSQIMRVLNFHRIDRGIVLPNQFLTQCGLVWGGSSPSSPAVVPQQKSVVTLPSVAKVISPAPEPVKHSLASALAEDYDDEDDDDDEVEQSNEVKVGIRIGGLNASQSVADFLNGTNGR
jgi:hypothetical protein